MPKVICVDVNVAALHLAHSLLGHSREVIALHPNPPTIALPWGTKYRFECQLHSERFTASNIGEEIVD